jgi:hypothetical protein
LPAIVETNVLLRKALDGVYFCAPFGFAFGFVGFYAAKESASRVESALASRLRVKVCQLDLRPDSTDFWVFTNYTASFLGGVKECNRMRSDTTIGSYSLSSEVIQFFQESPEVDTFAPYKVSNRRSALVAHDRNRRGG